MKNLDQNHHTDLVVVGAGILGCAHAVEALSRGLTVRIIERDSAAVGASVRNFGHACITAQAASELPMAQESRRGWLEAARTIGFWAPEAGAVVVARSREEMAVLEQFRDARGTDAAQLLTGGEVRRRLHADDARPSGAILGGAFLPADLRVDPRATVGAIAAWLEAQDGATIAWRTSVREVADGIVETSRGTFTGDHVVVCAGHDVDHLFPDVAERWEIVRCALQMARSTALPGYTLDSAVLTGTSMLRYGGFSAMPAAEALREEVHRETPELLDMVANVMFTRLSDGSLLLGDSHDYAPTSRPFMDEGVTDRLLQEIGSVLGTTPRIRERWQGVYASSALTNLVAERTDPRTTVATVTSGIGMTLSFGLARHTLDGL
ncbi:TIGR03364 family FAD-dependent oxidoreductase [Arthrobacter methylotrophus]|uniref:TIGR03364 family FAD-dependent oxidoreductase n=1 Tax=Arthrobacter methylotrophus TaxID=121291 RepID=A0ABV5UVN2_9MICC